MRVFEIVRTADEAFHARLVINGEITWVTENYTRLIAAQRAITSLSDTFSAEMPGFDYIDLREPEVPC